MSNNFKAPTVKLAIAAYLLLLATSVIWSSKNESPVERNRNILLRVGSVKKASFWLEEKFADGDSVADRVYEYKRHAVKELASLGAEAAPAADALVQLLGCDDPFLAFAAADALTAIGPAALPTLIKAASTTNLQSRTWAISLLGDVAPSNQVALSLLKTHLADTNEAVVAAAVSGLAKMGPYATEASSDILALIARPNPTLRYEIVNALWRIKRETHLGALESIISGLPATYQRRIERLRLEMTQQH